MTATITERRKAWRIGFIAGLLLLTMSPASRAATVKGFVQTPGQMSIGHDRPAMVVLPSGKVLIAGGLGGIGILPTILDSAELFDSKTGQFSMSNGRMSNPRVAATGTLLPNGKVLIAGGLSALSALASADVYDPVTDTFSPTENPMSSARVDQTSTLLADGTELIAGGTDVNSNPLATAEIYDPSTNRFTLLPNLMTDARVQAAAVRLQSGQVFIAGGGIHDLTSAEIYDPATQTFSATDHSMTTGRFNPAATLLADGAVFISGGRQGLADLASTEIYDPEKRMFFAGPTMGSVRLHHFSVLLPSGQVLVGGGNTSFLKKPTDSAELYDPQRNQIRPTSQPLRIGRSAAAATSAVVL